MSRQTPDPTMPTLTVAEAAKFCRRLGVPHIKERTIMTAIYRRDLKRHLIANHVLLSEADIKTWLKSTSEVEFVSRHVPGKKGTEGQG